MIKRAVAIPADIDLEDRLIAGLTVRQAVILGTTAVGLYAAWSAVRALDWPLVVFLALAVPVAATAIAVALGARDGISLDRWIAAALAHHTRTRAMPSAPRLVGDPGALAAVREPRTPLVLPVRDVGEAGGMGVVDLGADGLAVAAVASTVSFALRSPEEQDAMVAVFARYLHSASAPIQLLIRAMPLDLSGHIDQLHRDARSLPHPALAAAALGHAEHLCELAGENELLRRQVILVLREPLPPRPPGRDSAAVLARADRVALTRLTRRLIEAAELLAPAGITVTALDADQLASVLATAIYPYRDHTTEQAEPDRTDEPEPCSDVPGWYPLPIGAWR